jgi:signal transduction histidine kinase
VIDSLRIDAMFGKRWSPGERLLAVFVLTILGPGLLLAIFGVRALLQERNLAERQLQARLDHGAEATIRALADQFLRFRSLVDQDFAPEKAFADLPQDGTWAWVSGEGRDVVVYPPDILPYALVPPDEVASDPELAHAEELEMRESDPARAVERYRDLAKRIEPALLPTVKHRLARSLRRAGRSVEATRLWREVKNAGDRIGALPADLVAGFELASIDDDAAHAFHRQLTAGQWKIEKARYLYYLSEIRERLSLNEGADPRLQLAEAVEAAHASRSNLVAFGDAHFVFRRRGGPFAALVVGPEFLKKQVWPRILTTPGSDAVLSRVTANGQTLYSSAHEPSGLQATRMLDEGGVSWKVEVAPMDAAGFHAAMNRRTNLFLAMLLTVLVVLAFGGYIISRTVRRELEVARMKADFVSTVSHEFRSPLTGIRQLGEMLLRDRVSGEDKRRQYYELIVREGDRLARLVENALDFARMEEGRKQYHFELLDTASWLGDLTEEFQREANRTGHRLDASIPERLPTVRGDREALSTALHNLLDNACKYSPESTTVWLKVEAVDGGVRVEVSDRGVGIPAHAQSQIFDKFYRVGGEMSKRVKGAGLGLSLVQHIVAAHQGRVSVESVEGEGSTFSVFLAGAA